MEITLGIGTNLGDRAENIRLAIQLLAPTVTVTRVSSVYETEPWGYADQPSFYNVAAAGKTELDPRSLLSFVKSIERRMKRAETFRNGPRIIDIDILYYEKDQFRTESLTIPHPQIANRRFVLGPLLELFPDGSDPITQIPFRALLAAAPRSGVTQLDLPLSLEKPVFRFGVKTYTMGILNLTPDSFSQDGLYRENSAGQDDPSFTARVLAQSGEYLRAGASVLDLGAESTRPSFTPVPSEDELNRLLPAFRVIRDQYPKAVLSIDTTKAIVAEAALNAGADWLNDVSGGMRDPEMIPLAAGANCPIVLMRAEPLTNDATVIDQVLTQLDIIVNHALKQGLRTEQIIIDPGIGFGTSVWDNLEIMRNLDTLKKLGFPILLGPSRKSVIGKTMQRDVNERIGGTAALVSAGVKAGCDLIRVHDVDIMDQAVRMCDLIWR